MRGRLANLGSPEETAQFAQALDALEVYAKTQQATVGVLDREDLYGQEIAAHQNVVKLLEHFTTTNVTKLATTENVTGLRGQLDCAFELLSFLTERSNGTLPPTPPTALAIRAQDKSKRDAEFVSLLSKERSVVDEPLFPHEPCVQDVTQRGLGDCYLLAALGSAVTAHPENIRSCMRDNGDGTVTVRFHDTTHRFREPTPVYVTVSKKAPRVLGKIDSYGANSLWVQMLERAYAASGLHDLNN